MDKFVKYVGTAQEAVEVINQLQPFLSQHELEVRKEISNTDEVTEPISQNIRSSTNRKRLDEMKKEGSSFLGLQWTITDDSFQACQVTIKKRKLET